MSVQAMAWVLEDAPGLPPHLVATLMGLANHADQKGRAAWCSQPTLARYTRKSVRAVRKDLRELQTLGLIRLGDQRIVSHLPADRRPVVYDLAMPSDATDGNGQGVRRPGGAANRAHDGGNHSSGRGDLDGGNHSSGRGDLDGRNYSSGRNCSTQRAELWFRTGRNHSSAEPYKEPKEEPSSSEIEISDATNAPPGQDTDRVDVDRLCTHLRDRIIDNGTPASRVVISRRWRDAARLLLDRDGRAEAEVHAAIDWCQDDDFWRGVILSMPALRKRYDQLRLVAQRAAPAARNAQVGERRRRLAATIEPDPPPEVADDPAAYLDWLAATRQSIAEGTYTPPQARTRSRRPLRGLDGLLRDSGEAETSNQSQRAASE